MLIRVFEEIKRGPDVSPPRLERTDLAHYLKEVWIGTYTFLHRRDMVVPVEPWVRKILADEKVLLPMRAREGEIAFINEHMVAYRVHPERAFSGIGREEAIQ